MGKEILLYILIYLAFTLLGGGYIFLLAFVGEFKFEKLNKPGVVGVVLVGLMFWIIMLIACGLDKGIGFVCKRFFHTKEGV